VRLETFLVRIWTGADSDDDSMSTARQPDPSPPDDDRLPADPAPPRAMRGLVRHVRSGRESTFAGEADLIAILRAATATAETIVPTEPAPVLVGQAAGAHPADTAQR
jgi:hypothetical protein